MGSQAEIVGSLMSHGLTKAWPETDKEEELLKHILHSPSFSGYVKMFCKLFLFSFFLTAGDRRSTEGIVFTGVSLCVCVCLYLYLWAKRACLNGIA